MWDESIQLTVVSYTAHHIDARVVHGDVANAWRFTGMYGWSSQGDKHHTLGLIRKLHEDDHHAWLMVGDFNLILSRDDKEGGVEPSLTDIFAFRETMENYGLSEVEFNGNRFTWDNGRKENEFIQERIDYAFANEPWMERFPGAIISHLERQGSDHIPLMVYPLRIELEVERSRTGSRPHRFEVLWAEDVGCDIIVRNAWENPNYKFGVGGVMGQVDYCMKELLSWNKTTFGNVMNRLRKVREELRDICKNGMSGRMVARRRELELRELELMDQEEKIWYARSRANELRWGDRNSRYFHKKANGRNKRNKIKRLVDDNGMEWRSGDGMARVAVDYFNDLFKANSNAHPSTASQGISPLLSDADNAKLLHPFSGEEVYSALFSMHPTKAPGPDGMSALFFQQHWHIVGPYVTSFVLDILNGAPFPDRLNYTFISLIPKVTNPSKMKDLRPISLCNVLYKIISKVLANRLKVCLGKVVSPNQSAFVPGRLITDNVLSAFEFFHYMKKRCVEKQGYLALKLDMAKAYDRVEWDFLEHCMVKMGFHCRWIEIIMRCIKSVSFSVLVEGVPSGEFRPSRRLRQRDPLSPYLFLLCAEAFSGLIRRSEELGRWKGIRIARGAPSVSNLFFADDSILFAKASCQQSEKIVQILQCFGAASGQQVNFGKSELSFSMNVSDDLRESIQEILEVVEVDKHDRYLGLPTMIGRSKKVIFNQVKEKVWSKLKGWKGKYVSRAGKEVLIKSVLQSIPMYTMSCFYLTSGVCREIEQMLCKFWWGEVDQRKIHWMDWRRLCRSKREGGMGFRDLEAFNVALLARQGWRILKDPDTLLAKLLKSRYFPSSSVLEAGIGYQPSYAWRSIMRGIEALRTGVCWTIGNGASVSTISDPWLPRPHSFRPIRMLTEIDESSKVIDLIDWSRGEWMEGEVRRLFTPTDADLILNIHLVDPGMQDEISWYYETSGSFSVKSCYFLQKDITDRRNGRDASASETEPNSFWDKVWKIKVPPRVRAFAWRCATNTLPCKGNLKRRHCAEDDKCFVCGGYESICHVLFECPRARTYWRHNPGLRKVGCEYPDFSDRIGAAINIHPPEIVEKWLMIAHVVWSARNKLLFEGVEKEVEIFLDNQLRWLTEYQRSVCKENRRGITVTAGDSKWRKPPMGFMKINVDASVNEDGCGVGLVARDKLGEVCFMGSKRIQQGSEPAVAEAEGVLWAVQCAVEQELTHVIIEADCLLVIHHLQKQKITHNALGLLVEKIRQVARSLEVVQWRFARRNANVVAHMLARVKPFNLFFVLGFVEFTCGLYQTVLNDVAEN